MTEKLAMEGLHRPPLVVCVSCLSFFCVVNALAFDGLVVRPRNQARRFRGPGSLNNQNG